MLNSRMLRVLQRSIRQSTISHQHQHFSVLFMSRQDVISSFDKLITDTNAEELKKSISKALGKNYLSVLTNDEKQSEQTRTGIIYGKSRRGLITIPTKFSQNNPIWIHYLIDTGSPSPYLTYEAIHSLLNPGQQIIGPMQVAINGVKITVDRSSQHFEDVNILGMDYIIDRKSLTYHLAGKEKSIYLEMLF